MNDAMTPKNELEQRIQAVLNDEISNEDFMRALQTSQVFMPVADDTQIKNFQRSNKIEPLLVEVEDGSKVLILFSSPDRGKAFLADYPGYKGGLLVEFAWVLLNVEGEYGIAINPGWDLGVDLEPQMVQRLN
ncbi:MAG: hypothetical protein A2V58_00530 [Candidatus Muproteobacteria bacterium RBG_19FT_COMBO_61_10]|jgi:hypothetical protein|uniref:SseB protein N-terminal domain-containing protein n=1 Tax=Candidatus Muproteobacteria bacterium RBG_19FT_COMBO_61_10 TaxID=1817761 RepID=A0A1F6UEP6_9PROT|nr:MAG: hypothetical protein A2V58_00530 [Candidatus Muproteobacteria bacterium RBG_19FT_COMBO_61_10]